MHAPITVHMKCTGYLGISKEAQVNDCYSITRVDYELRHLQMFDWAGLVSDRRSTLGYCTFVGGDLVTWRSKKQNVMVRSSAEANYEYVSYYG